MTKLSRREIITTMAGMLVVATLVPTALVPALAIPVVPVMDTSTFIEKSTDLLVVRCLNPDVQGGGKTDGLTLIEVEVLVVLKGERKVGHTRLASIGQRIERGQRYLLASFGGSAFDTGFVAQSDQTVVELPPEFDLKSLEGIVLLERVQSIFDARQVQVERLIRQLTREKAMLDQIATSPTAPKN